MRVPYSFSILRYVHDPVTQEFVNIGVTVFSPEARYLRAICTAKYGRIANMFLKVDGQRFRELARYIEGQINAAGADFESALPFDSGGKIEYVLAKVLPPDDSTIQFSKAGVGLTSDPDQTLRELFERHVEVYADSGETPRRSDDDVWRVFREPLDRAHITPMLKPKRIVGSNFDYEFRQSWKNERWHVYEPVSLDLKEAPSILRKANHWLGQATSLSDSSEPFQIHFLLGAPQDERLMGAFQKAENILNTIPGPKEFVRESEAESFAEELAREVDRHRAEEFAE